MTNVVILMTVLVTSPGTVVVSKSSLAILLLFITVLLPGRAHAIDAAYIIKNLPQKYTGYFQWQRSRQSATVNISINRTGIDKEGNVIVVGSGSYNTDGVITEISVKWKIVPSTLYFEMWESDPASKWKSGRRFSTSGSHVGNISDDLGSIKAVWTAKSGGAKADIVLHSVVKP